MITAFSEKNPFSLNLGSLKAKIFLFATLLVSGAVFVPFAPNLPYEGLDPSWAWGMNEAVARKMSFGKDIVFTFGPYASIYTQTFHPATDHLMMWGSVYLAIFFVIIVYLNFKLTSWSLQITLLVVLSTVMYSKDALFMFYPMLVGVRVYQYVTYFSRTRLTNWRSVLLTMILFTPFGLYPLIKGSLLFACVPISILSMVLLAMRAQWKSCLLIGVTPLISGMLFWAFSGQPLFGIADYFAGLIPIVSGYTEAMAVDGDPIEWILYVVATAFLAGSLLRAVRGSNYEKFIVVLIFLTILFLAFKASFVRHDGHALCAGVIILLATLLASTLLPSGKIFILVFLSAITWAYIDAAHAKTSTLNIKERLSQRYLRSWDGLKQRIFDPEALTKAYADRIHELNIRGEVPKLNGSVDIYSYDQAYLFASGNAWNPRPVFQSYSAYTPKLANLNKKHLASIERPDNIIFKVQPIDGRLPPLEDGASWPALMSNYVPVSYTEDYLLLKVRTTTNNAYGEPEKIGEGVYHFGERIDLPKTDAPLFARVNIRKSFIGVILNALFKPGQLTITLENSNGAVRKYRIVSGMAKAGFLLSPLVESTQEYAVLLSGAHHLSNKRVESIKLSPASSFFSWNKTFEIEFYRLNYQPAVDFFNRMDFARPRQAVTEKILPAHGATGFIDFINGWSPSQGLVMASSVLCVTGWLAASLDPPEVPEKVYLVLSNPEGMRYLINTKRTDRADVGAYFKKPQLNSSGYSCTANVSNLRGIYTLGLAYEKDEKIFLAPSSTPILINQDK